MLVSDSYPDPQAVGQRWADYLASLLHGSELGRVNAYVLTRDEMSFLCGPYALGCYGGDEPAFIGDTVSGVTPEEVAAHEYGHHVAANRPNPPWLSAAWGPKRWASAANICARTQQGTAFPGNEDDHYELNPGEGYAEVYRVLNELKKGATTTAWTLVDSSFSPDAAALQAAEQDVLTPWTAPVGQTFRGRFAATDKRIWKVALATPFDGSLAATLTFPRGSLHDLSLLGPDGRVLGRGLWSGVAEKKLTTTVCGQRSVVIRVTRAVRPVASRCESPMTERRLERFLSHEAQALPDCSRAASSSA